MSEVNRSSSLTPRSLYLTEVDRHRVTKERVPKPLETHELRRQMFLLLLFWDNLVVSDSTINNNEKLRPLLLPEIENPSLFHADVLPDFKHLLKSGYVRVAMRHDLPGFKELLREQQKPTPAPNLPTPEYTEAIDELIPEESRLRWRRDVVESYFKENLIGVFSSKTPFEDHGIPREASEALLRFIRNKGDDPITYRELRHFIEHPDDYSQTIVSPIASIQVRAKRFRNAIEKCISDSYRLNVPAALGLECETTPDSLPWWVKFGDTSVQPTELRESYKSTTRKIRPCWIFDEEVLGQIPATALDGVKSLQSYRDFMTKLGESGYPTESSFWAKEFIDAWETYTIDLEKLLRGEINRRLEQKISEKSRKNKLEVTIGLIYDILIAPVSIQFPLLEIPQIFFNIYTAWTSSKDYQQDMQHIAHFGRLCGKPIIRQVSGFQQ